MMIWIPRFVSADTAALIRYSAVCSLLLAGVASGHAQSVTSTSVAADEAGAAVPKAMVKITKTGTEIRGTVITSEKGDFTIANVEPGFYGLSAEHEALKRTVIDRIALRPRLTPRDTRAVQVTVRSAF